MACENSSPLHKNNNNSNNNETIQLVSPLFCATLFLWEPWRQRKTDCKKTCISYMPSLSQEIHSGRSPEWSKQRSRLNSVLKQPDKSSNCALMRVTISVKDSSLPGWTIRIINCNWPATESQYRQLSTEMTRLEELHRRNNITDNDYEKAVAGIGAVESTTGIEPEHRQLHPTSFSYIGLYPGCSF